MQPKAKVIKIPYHLILLLLLGAACPAQSVKLEYLPKNGDSLKAFVSSLAAKKAKEFGPQYQKEIKNALEERREHFIRNIQDSSFIYNSELNQYLKGVLAKIYAGNPQLPHKDFYFFIDRSPIPNAGCFGNGIFTVNLGLFSVLESEAQLASVLCHEIAHFQLKHNDKSLLTHIEATTSRDTRKRVGRIQKQWHGRRQSMRELQRELSYNFMKRNRSAEMQADSLGIHLLGNAGYGLDAAINSLRKLKESDSLLFASPTQIRHRMNFEGYPFKEVWLQAETTLFDNPEIINDHAFDKDSIKSHPDIDKRIEVLMMTGVQALTDQDLFYGRYRNLANHYMLQSALDATRIDIALYQALAMAENGLLDNTTYALTVGRLIQKTYEYKLNHSFGKHVGPLSPFSEETYLNEVKLFLHRLEVKNLRRIGHFFCQKYKQELKNTPEFEQLTAFFQALNPN